MLDTILLSRIQFGFTVGFHIIFPTLNIGLGLSIAIMEAVWLKTKNPFYLNIAKFWTKIFALTFGMGVVSGIVLSYELGTNFGPFIEKAGGVLGPLFSYEVLSAFFLEAGFLGVMLFGWKRVPPTLHFMSTLLVSVGTLISAFWIMSANSWMQTPSGFHLVDGKYVVESWFSVIFNPSFIPRFLHMVNASYVTACFFIAGISAWYLLKKKFTNYAKTCFSLGLTAGFFLVLTQIGLGDWVGLKIKDYQPLKTAAMEGLWDTQKGAPLLLFAIPDSKMEKNKLELKIPKLASLINTHQWDGELIGLKSVSASERPPIGKVFWNFRLMTGIGFLMLGIIVVGLTLRRLGKLYSSTWFYKLCILSTPLGFIASISGWITAETGRQPWVIYGLMRTHDGAALVPPYQVATSLLLFILVYGIVFSFYLVYLGKLIQKGPEEMIEPQTPEDKIEETPFKYLGL